MNKVVHFEVPTTNSAASRKFYQNVLGWEFVPYGGGPVEYWLITTGPEGAPGINGGLGGAANDFKATVNTVEVEDLEAILQKVLANGGEVVMPRADIPGVGYLAYVREPGGALLGMIQNLPGQGA